MIRLNSNLSSLMIRKGFTIPFATTYQILNLDFGNVQSGLWFIDIFAGSSFNQFINQIDQIGMNKEYLLFSIYY